MISQQDSCSLNLLLLRSHSLLPLYSFQIFPDPVEVVLPPVTTLSSPDPGHGKERLPSIVVEPTEVSEVESGELRWPPESIDMDQDEEDLFLEQCIPPANIADWGEEEEEEEEETLVILNPQHGLTLIGEQNTLLSTVQPLFQCFYNPFCSCLTTMATFSTHCQYTVATKLWTLNVCIFFTTSRIMYNYIKFCRHLHPRFITVNFRRKTWQSSHHCGWKYAAFWQIKLFLKLNRFF